MTGSKKLKEWKARINKLDEEKINAADPELMAILSELRSIEKETIRIGDCKEKHIEEILSLNISRVRNPLLRWMLPKGVIKHEPSQWLKDALHVFFKRWHRNSENTTRTLIDLMLLDVLDHSAERIGGWGEVELSWTDGPIILTGYSDYVLSYGDLSDKTDMSSVLVCGEAKCSDAKQNIWQIVAYCGIVHKARLALEKQNVTVYGFMTDGDSWEFVRIDNESNVWTTKVSTLRKAMTWLRYILDCAQKSTPSSTPTTSKTDLRKKELKNFKLVVERFRTMDGVDESEDDEDEEEEEEVVVVEEDGTDLVESMDKLNISSRDL
ncbi:hypothetical protein BDK51DRAFT_41873 [Blyttiomyces helicus]|uniref:Uncharacterized protein n=1 Tax=Blyttiomyces helicus TaxID=388810 RepID=A0A4P9WG89_9FUNG|nr:hypothetical protein BDK51DRAFT_41873 [Blyttiomyces helicus]|eukprot:RKO90823.1 hypothetical protein BDK51DRAFT_41873 [Blyttiomyces helicus]